MDELPDIQLPAATETPPLPDKLLEAPEPVQPLPPVELPERPGPQLDVAGSLPAMPDLPDLPPTSLSNTGGYDGEPAELGKAPLEMPSLPDLPQVEMPERPILPDLSAGASPPRQLPQLQPLDQVQTPMVFHEAPGDVQLIRQEVLQQKYAKDDLPHQVQMPEAPELPTPHLPDLPNADLPKGNTPEAPHFSSGGDSLAALSGLLSQISAGIKKLVEAAEKPATSEPAATLRYSSRYDE